MVQTDFGGPEVVGLEHVPDPRPLPHQVVVEVGACALNRLDVLQRRGPSVIPGFRLPHIAGMDVAGTVVAVGDRVTGVALGDRVVADPIQGCDDCEQCALGAPSYCRNVQIVGGNIAGGLAEFVAVSAETIVQVPADITLSHAATLPTAWATAWHALHAIGKLRPGECVVVPAGASSISLAVITLAKRAGATVVAAASTETKLVAATTAGAHLVVPNHDDLVAAVLSFTGGRGADLVVDHVGAQTWAASLACLAIRGRLIMLGNTSGDGVGFSLADVFHRGLQLLGAGGYTSADFRSAVTACLHEDLSLPSAGEWSLEELPGAWRAAESRDTVGKVIVHP